MGIVADVEVSFPIEFVREKPCERLGAWARLLALAIAGGCLAVLIVAASLIPSPDGLGTHREMGLYECQFLARTGIPCPGCGMTTSFSWFVRGNVAASFYVQPMGCILAALCCMCVWAGVYIAATGRPVYRLLGVIPGRYLYMPLLALAVAAWGWKIFIHLSHHDGW
ncbi:MAG TPA: DUF2752 domain-containing protein [Tepidisphaeraceae bacterium]|nr:DUF2752 domain-containing protein [Tepidisphaeraceae bacterium]